MNDELKRCIHCQVAKPIAAYALRDGLPEGTCRACRNAMRREARQARIHGIELPRRRRHVSDDGPKLMGWRRNGMILRPVMEDR